MIKIKIFEGGPMNGGIYSSTDLKKAILSCFNPDNADIFYKDKQVYITDTDDFTHAIIINTAMPTLNIPKTNVIGLAWEPFEFLKMEPIFIDYAIKHIGRYYIGDKHNLPEPFIERYGFLTYNSIEHHGIATSKPISKGILQKNNIMSIVLSWKRITHGQQYRHQIVQCILHNNLPIDIYGSGYPAGNNVNDTKVKGKFICEEPYLNYYFTIAIENFRSNHYFSEKIINPLLYDCQPIYLGCLNIDSYLNDCSISLTGNMTDDMNLIVQILLNPLSYYKKQDKQSIIKNVNLLLNLDTLF